MMLCFRSACLMILYAMLCGLSAKSQYNPGTWVLNLTGLIIFCSFNPSSLSSLFTFFFCVCVAGACYFCTERKISTNAVLFR